MGWQDAPVVSAGAQPSAAPAAKAASWQDAPVVGSAPRGAKGDTAFGTVKDFVSGESKIEFPELPNIDEFKDGGLFDAGGWRAAVGMLFATDDQQKIDILQKSFPGAKFSADAFGNPIMEALGQRVYVNKPGMRAQDAMQGGAQAAAFLGVGKALPAIAGAVPGLKTAGAVMEALPGVVQAAGTGAATSAALDLGAHAAGAEKVVDLPRAGTNAAFGAAFELASPLVSKAANVLRGALGSQQFVDQVGNLTPEATVVLERAGIDPAQVSDEFRTHFAQLARDAVSPDDAARLAQSRTLPVPVPETRGSLSGLPSDQMTESLAAKGAYGEDAQRIMRGMVAEQQDAIRGNVGAIQQRMGGQLTERGQGGALAQQALQQAQGRTKRATGAAYDAAEKAPALLESAKLAPFAMKVGQAMESYGSQAPGAKEKFGELAQLATGKADATSVKALFDWRRRTSELARAAPNATEAAALSKMLTTFDDGIEDTVKQALMTGDDDAARLWLRAIGIRRGEARRFQSKDLIADLLDTEYAGGQRRLKVAPEQAANYIFGAADTGFITKPQLARDLSRLRARLGETSDAWRGLKEEAWLRFANQGEGAAQGASRAFSGVKFKKAWDQAWNKNGPTMRVLFDDRERRLIDTFAEVSARVTGKVAGGDNPSGTTVALSQIVQKLSTLSMFGPKAAALLTPVVGAAVKFQAGRNVARSLSEPLKTKQLPKGLVSGVGTAAANLMTGSGQ
jgi:hypothetical protein